MTWPQSPAPAPTPAASGGPGLGLIAAVVTAVAGVLTFLFSFVRIYKLDVGGREYGRSVWTTEPGLFGVGTWIPVFALVAAALALLGAFAPGTGDKQVLGFRLGQLQLVAAAFSFLLWLGYTISIFFADGNGFDYEFGLGAVLLFLGTAGTLAGSAVPLFMPTSTGAAAVGTGTAPTPPGQTQWQPPLAPEPPSQPQWQSPEPSTQPWQPAAAASETQGWQTPSFDTPAPQPQQAEQAAAWQPQVESPQQPAAWQPQPEPAPPPATWQPEPAPTEAPPAPAGPPQQPAWDQTIMYGGSEQQSWQAEPAGTPPPATPPPTPQPWDQPAPAAPAPEPQPWQPAPATTEPEQWQPAGPQHEPIPEGGGGLFDPGTQVIPGPPPAPPPDELSSHPPDDKPPPPPPPPAPPNP